MPAGANFGDIASLTLYDAGNEPTSFQIWGTTLTAANFAALQGEFTNVVNAAMALVLGAKARTRYGNDTNFAWTQPTNGAAREIALLVQFQDTVTGQRLTAKLGTLDPEAVTYVDNINAKDVVLLTEPAPIVTFIGALDAFAVNPWTGNQLEVIGLKVVRGAK